MVCYVSEEKRAYHAYERYVCLPLRAKEFEGETHATADVATSDGFHLLGISTGKTSDKQLMEKPPD